MSVKTNVFRQGHPLITAGMVLVLALSVSWLTMSVGAAQTGLRPDTPQYGSRSAFTEIRPDDNVGQLAWPAMPAAPAAPVYRPQTPSDECRQLLGNPAFTLSGSSFAPWQVLNPNIYSSSQNYISAPTSAVMADNDSGDPTPTEDALGQMFTMPADLTSVTIEYQSGTGNANTTDKAFGNLWTVDAEDNLDTLVGGWQIPDSANSWTKRTVVIDDAADLAAMAGRKMAIVLFTETNGATPNENIFLDDMTLTACYGAAAEPTATPTRRPADGQQLFMPAVFNPAGPPTPTPTPRPTTTPGDWRLEVVARDGDQGGSSSIDLDSRGNPHVSFIDMTRGRVVYAKRTGAGWQTQDIDGLAVANPRTASALAIGPNDLPQITYNQNDPVVHLRHAQYDGSSWSAVQFSGVRATWLAMALKQDGEPCISYYETRNIPGASLYNFKIRCRTGGVWPENSSTITPDLSGTAEMEKSIHALVIGNGDRRHLSYTTGTLYYLREIDARTWMLSTVDDGGSGRVGFFPSLALDSEERPHFSYYDLTNGDLKYARRDGDQWHRETIDSSGDVGKYTSIGVDNRGRVHISYYDVSNKNLKYALWDGSRWQIETLDSAGEVGEYTSLALDAAGAVYISYYDRTNGDLKVATTAAAR